MCRSCSACEKGRRRAARMCGAQSMGGVRSSSSPPVVSWRLWVRVWVDSLNWTGAPTTCRAQRPGRTRAQARVPCILVRGSSRLSPFLAVLSRHPLHLDSTRTRTCRLAPAPRIASSCREDRSRPCAEHPAPPGHAVPPALASRIQRHRALLALRSSPPPLRGHLTGARNV